MKHLTYRFTTALSKKFGVWIFKTAAWIIAAMYYLLIPGRTATGVRFYRALFPDKNFLYHLACTWKQYQNFTKVFLDRFILEDFGDITYTSEGWEFIEEAARNKTGGILLMSHIGNWEVAAHLLRKKGIRMMLYMGIKEKEQIERAQKESLERSGLKIVAVPRDGGSPFDIIEGINFLKDGGLLSLTGDMIWRKDQRVIKSSFLGHEVLMPEAPHLFALLSGAPLFIFFVFKTGERTYHFKISSAKYVKAPSRAERPETMRKSVEDYLGEMENAVRQHPHQWFHFEPFLGKKS